MGNMERMKKRYGPEVAASYPVTGPGRPGYDIYAGELAEACAGKSGLRVLDLGCGTGRYFHCLKNVSSLVGIDISPDMLEVAAHVYRELPNLSDAECVLIEADFQSLQFVSNSFDLIYSIGVVGELIPITQDLLDKIARWLAPDGKVFFTVVDKVAHEKEKVGERAGFRQVIKRALAASPLYRFVSPRLAAKFIFSYNFQRLYKSQNEMERMFDNCSIPIQYQIIRFRDAKHPKIGCKIVKNQE